MEVKEFRIGNWYNDKRINRDFVVLEIRQRSIDHGYTDYSPTRIENVKGIELTPEWLERFGFKQGDNVTANDSFYEIPVGGSMLAINPDNGVVWITRNNNSFNNPALVEHLHQLQNLFFALTGRELELKK